MRKSVFVSFNEGRAEYAFVYNLLRAIECEEGLAGNDDFLCGLYGRTFDSEDKRLRTLRAALSQHGIHWSERVDHIYTDVELRSFALLHLDVRRTEISPFGSSHGTAFDLSMGCPECGCGAVQTSPFYAPPKSLPRSGLLCASSSEVFVADALADALRKAETTGVELRRVLSSRDRAPLPWWQIIPRHTMPKMSRATKGIIHDGSPLPCPTCRRDGHFLTVAEPEQITYAKGDVHPDSLPDVVQTWESFGKSYLKTEEVPRDRFNSPAILVKPGVFDIFRSMKVKHADFTPVHFID